MRPPAQAASNHGDLQSEWVNDFNFSADLAALEQSLRMDHQAALGQRPPTPPDNDALRLAFKASPLPSLAAPPVTCPPPAPAAQSLAQLRAERDALLLDNRILAEQVAQLLAEKEQLDLALTCKTMSEERYQKIGGRLYWRR